jgi:arylsulfatase A-like enzyme
MPMLRIPLFLITGVILLTSASALLARQPNVVVILTDDQGWGDLSLNGNTNLHTPNIDGLARDGASFDRFFVCPVCSPTRAEFLTGRYHGRCGVYSTSAGGERINLDETTIAQTFKAANYATAAFGKWHNGMQYPYHPNGRGFDEYYGFCSGHWGNYFSPPLERNGKIVQGEGFVVDDFTNKAMEFIETNKDRPFFAYLPFNTPHSPMQVPDRFWKKFKDAKLKLHNRTPNKENLPHVRAALAMCENIDWNVGRLLKKLDVLKLAEDTIVVYFCDNGPNGVRWNGDMKGRKGSTDEGGVRSPLLIRWPGTIEAGKQIKQHGAAIDLLPTLASLSGVKVTSKKKLDGIDLKPALTGDGNQLPDRVIFSTWRGRVSARTPQYRLGFQGQLFDMTNDPGQRVNVAKKNPGVAKRLAQQVAAFKNDVIPGTAKDARRFPIGHIDYRWTQIPARDGKESGGIKRSNRFPNCSFFTNWTKLADTITWDTEVTASGTYEVELHYACPKADVGSTVELTVGDQKLVFKIDEAHEAPLRGDENDRVKRAESYVKAFKPIKLGKMKLRKGETGMSLRATKLAGAQVMEFRLIMFERVD